MVQLKLVNVLFWDVYCLQVFQFQMVLENALHHIVLHNGAEEIDNCDFSEYFWKYASDSPYYTRLIYHIRRCLEDEVNVLAPVSQVENLEEKESFVRRLSVVFFPYKSRRREILKKVVKEFIHI